MPVDTILLQFIGDLREAGMGISVAESMDAARAIGSVPLERMGALRGALSTTLVKNESDIPLFDAVFERFFVGAAVPGEHPGEDGPAGLLEGASGQPLDRDELSLMLEAALVHGSADEITALASLVAAALGQAEGGFGQGTRPLTAMAGSGYYVFRAMEWLDFRDMAARLEEEAQAGELLPGLPPLLATEEVRERMERFRNELEREIRRRLVAARGGEVGRRKRLPVRPEEVEFTQASFDQVEDMRRILPGLARRLAARLARKKGAGKWGRVDIRNTLRHSLSSGGVPLEVKYRRKVPSRPELFVLCDVSGSVRTFSSFTLQLVYSLHQQFSKVRSFVFIDTIEEVTENFKTFDVAEAVEHAYREAHVVDGDGHSDVGRAIEHFQKRFGDEITARSTVLVLSDARNNAKDSRAEALEEVKEKARRVYWLNPEPRDKWNSGDSIMADYEGHCYAVYECRNLKQLSEFVYRGA